MSYVLAATSCYFIWTEAGISQTLSYQFTNKQNKNVCMELDVTPLRSLWHPRDTEHWLRTFSPSEAQNLCQRHRAWLISSLNWEVRECGLWGKGRTLAVIRKTGMHGCVWWVNMLGEGELQSCTWVRKKVAEKETSKHILKWSSRHV